MDAWLARRLAGWLAKARRGQDRPREAQKGPKKQGVDRTSLLGGWLEATTNTLLQAFLRT